MLVEITDKLKEAVGDNYYIIRNSYASGDVYCIAGDVGGLIGKNHEYEEVINTFSNGEVIIDGAEGGGLVGRSTDTDSTINSYWDINTSDYDTSAGGEGRTTEQMQAGTANDQIDGENIYEDWDDGIWDFGTDNEYPGFYWE